VLVGGTGRNAPTDDLELVRFISEQFEPQPLFSSAREGRYLQLFPGGNNYVYVEYNRDSFTDRITTYNTFSGESSVIAPILEDEPFDSMDMISLSQDGTFLTFVATPFGRNTPSVYLYSLQTGATTRLTFDDAIYSYPVIEPNNSRVVVVRQIITGENAGTDLVLIDIATTFPSSLTTDRDNLIESYPRWSPDGMFVFYAARPEGTQNHDIYLVSPSNPGTGLIRVQSDGDDILPIPDPNGQFIAFASNRNGRYHIYLFNLTTTEITQQTMGNNTDNYPFDWR
jgi:Tol biopolymer transport system component